MCTVYVAAIVQAVTHLWNDVIFSVATEEVEISMYMEV